MLFRNLTETLHFSLQNTFFIYLVDSEPNKIGIKMSYIQSQLIKDEKVIYEGKTSLLANWFLILLGIATLVFFIGIIFLLIVAIRYFTT